MKEYENNEKKVLVADHVLSEEELRRFYGELSGVPSEADMMARRGRAPVPSNASEEAAGRYDENKIGEPIVLLWLLPIIGFIIFGFYADAKEHKRPVKEEVREFIKEWPSDMKNGFLEIWKALRE